MKGLFVSFEGTEGSGKTTQISLLVEHLRALGHVPLTLREPGGTPIGEEIRYTLKHSAFNQAMTAEAEMLLMNASRAQLVREVIRPALDAGEVVVCDRFHDSTFAYQGYGRGLDLDKIRSVIDFAVGDTRPHLTLLLQVPHQVSAQRLLARQSTLPFMRDRIEEADRGFFERVAKGYQALAAADPSRIKVVPAEGSERAVSSVVWNIVGPLAVRLPKRKP